jgi:hypothetical protein
MAVFRPILSGFASSLAAGRDTAASTSAPRIREKAQMHGNLRGCVSLAAIAVAGYY